MLRKVCYPLKYLKIPQIVLWLTLPGVITWWIHMVRVSNQMATPDTSSIFQIMWTISTTICLHIALHDGMHHLYQWKTHITWILDNIAGFLMFHTLGSASQKTHSQSADLPLIYNPQNFWAQSDNLIYRLSHMVASVFQWLHLLPNNEATGAIPNTSFQMCLVLRLIYVKKVGFYLLWGSWPHFLSNLVLFGLHLTTATHVVYPWLVQTRVW